MAYSASSSFTGYPPLAPGDTSSPCFDADPSMWVSGAQGAASTSSSYPQSHDHEMHHDEPANSVPLSQFQKSLREQDERFYSVFPEARPAANQWMLAQYQFNEIWDGVGFHFAPPELPSTSMDATEPTPSPVVSSYPNEPPAPVTVPFSSLHYNYNFNFVPHGSVTNATQDTEMSATDPYQTWGNPVQSPVDVKPEAYDQQYGDASSPYNSFSSSSIEAAIEQHPTPHQETHSLVSKENYTTHLPDPASPEEADSPSSLQAASPPQDLPFATTSDRHFLEEQHTYESPKAEDDWSILPAASQHRQLAPAPSYTLEGSLEPVPSTSKSPLQRHSGVHRHERRHSSARLVSPPPHNHHRCTTPKQLGRSSTWTMHRNRSSSPSLQLSPDSPTRRAQEKKPPLACLFCRGRKIACGPPIPGSKDKTCNQCQRRSLKCEYPSESRRGMRKKKANVNSSGPKVTVKSSKS
ncbi:hypothetical protein BDN72DRAFT_833609 [Pluteus cervinus]|uniref:Uncharacterized protein n=1 Tax=Pluteus cervinus TaxID=181527 RepID=A0ACD3B9E3_9AGAR|nr:hypothetical protein BDN72DRAFT_833609 [Pluteus cervinus]